MADSGVSQIILFASSIAIAGIVSGVLFQSVGALSAGLDWRGKALEESLRTDIQIINDPQKVTNNPTKIYVKNIGSTNLDKDKLTVLLDGAYTTYTGSLVAGAAAWKPGEVAEVSISGTQPAGNHFVRVATTSGVTADFSWTV